MYHLRFTLRSVRLFCSVLLSGVLVTSPAQSQTGNILRATAKSQFTPVYSQPQENQKPLGFAVLGKDYPVIRKENGWIQIKFFDSEGWVLEEELTLSSSASKISSPGIMQSASGERIKIAVRFTRVTTLPDSTSKVIGFAVRNEELSLLGRSEEYLKVDFRGAQGYVIAKASSTHGDLQATTEVSEPSTDNRELPQVSAPSPRQESLPIAEVVSDPPTAPVGAPMSEKTGVASGRSPPLRSTLTSVERTFVNNTPQQTTLESIESPLPTEYTSPAPAEHEPTVVDPLPDAAAVSPAHRLPAHPLWIIWVTILGGGIGVVGLTWLFLQVLGKSLGRLPSFWIASAGRYRNCIIVEPVSLRIRTSVLGSTIGLEDFLIKGGYRAKWVRNIESPDAMSLKHSSAQLLIMPWNLRNVGGEKIRENLSKSNPGLKCIYYGVPSLARVDKLRDSRLHFISSSISAYRLAEIIHEPMDSVPHSNGPRLSTESYSLAGDISPETMAELFQYIEATGKSGCLLAERNGPFGMVFFENGSIVHSSTQKVTGEPAVLQILGMDKGRFRFIATDKHIKKTIQLSTTGILMTWAQLRDEQVIDKYYTDVA